MKINKLIIAIILLSIAGTAWFYRYLPLEIALHFNVKGEVDNWGNRNFIWLTSALPLLVYVLMIIVPKIDPKKESYDKHKRAFSILANVIALFLVALNWFTILYSMGYDLNIQLFVLIGMGILFIIIGNYLPNARLNYTFGIRTPWTLSNETSWTKTHRLGGLGFVITGLLFVAYAFLPATLSFILLISTLILLVGGLTIYSYIVYRKSLS